MKCRQEGSAYGSSRVTVFASASSDSRAYTYRRSEDTSARPSSISPSVARHLSELRLQEALRAHVQSRWSFHLPRQHDTRLSINCQYHHSASLQKALRGHDAAFPVRLAIYMSIYEFHSTQASTLSHRRFDGHTVDLCAILFRPFEKGIVLIRSSNPSSTKCHNCH